MTDIAQRPSATDTHDHPAASGRFAVHRPPRSHPGPVPGGEVVLAPPPAPRAAAGGWTASLFPMLGGGGSLLLLTAGAPRRRWMVLAVVASLLLSLGAGLVPLWRQRRAARRERARYLDHLRAAARALERVAAAQRAAAEHLYPDLPGILAVPDRGGRLWERRPADEDFLAVRVGRGTVPLAAPVRLGHGPDPLAERDPSLLAAAEALVRRAGRLEAFPVVVPLRRAGVLAVTGPRAPARGLVRFLLAQLAVHHAPEELRILAACAPADAPVWEWLKWLPHVRERADGPGTTVPGCLLATTTEQLTAHLERELRPRLQAGAGPGRQPAHLLVLLDGFSPRGPLARLPLLRELRERAAELAATVLCLVDGRADEPAELGARIELDGAGGMVLQRAGPGGIALRARADAADGAHCEAVARRLAPLRLARNHDPGAATIAAPIRLLELLPAGEATALDPAERSRPRPRAGLLRVPIGLRGARDQGTLTADPLVLDLKEAAEGGMGPHGLLVGATGSGKSELLRTIVAGLAVTHPPELLSFVLVDFKGGAAFAGLEALPHTAGLITNLQADLALVDRVHAALRGEQQRRQRLLRRAGNLDGIARYHVRRAADPSLEPLPHLLLVVDEFGELLAARPEFLELFAAIGRIGRSLGVHLLLSSQRLDEGRAGALESHLRYRICLRTFTRADSMAVLGTGDAHTLPPHPGCGWLKVDSDGQQRFEGAVVSITGPGRRSPSVTPTVLPFEPMPPPAASPSPPGPAASGMAVSGVAVSGVVPAGPVPPADGGQAGSDMDAVVAAVSGAVLSDRRARRVWLPPLPAAIALDAVLPSGPSPAGTGARPGTDGWLRVPVGVVDRPFEQLQEPLLLDFAGAGGHLAIVGAPRSGKSMLLATLIAALSLTHAPDAVQLYCLDLGGGLLRPLAGLPHVGAVCGLHDRDEARHLVRELRALVASREPGLRDHGGGAGPGRPERPPPGLDDRGHSEVLLLVDDWGRLRQELPDLEAEIEALAATGLHHGLHLVVTATRWADLRLSLRDNLGGRLELRLNDPLESAVGRAAAAALPPDTPGRGLTSAGLLFQAALPAVTATVGVPDRHGGAVRWLAAAADAIARHAVRSPHGAVAPPLRRLPEMVAISDLPAGGVAANSPTSNSPVSNSPVTSSPVANSPAANGLAANGLAANGLPARSLATNGLPTRSLPANGVVAVGGDPPGAVPLGLHEHRLAPAWIDLLSGAPHFLVLGEAECGKSGVLRTLAAGLSARHPPSRLRLVVVDYRRTLGDLVELPHCGAYACTTPAALEAVAELRPLLERRLPGHEPAPPRHWGGPRHVLLVDDYHLLTGAGVAAGNPLEPLLDLLVVGGDIGLHLVLACAAGAAARAAFDPLLRRLQDMGSPGLLMSGDPRDGPLLGGRAAVPLPPGRGLLVRRRGASGLVQVAWTPPPVTAATASRAPRSHPP